MKKLLKLIFSRIFYIAVAILLQLVWFFVIIWYLSNVSTVIHMILRMFSAIVVLWLVNKKINPSYKLAWTILILVFPVFGVSFYLFFGNSRVAKVMQSSYEKVLHQGKDYLREDMETRKHLSEMDQSISNQSIYIREYSGFPIHDKTQVKYYELGDTMFPDMLEELSGAKHYIFMEYFIINDGIMWQAILDILEKKAAEGVDVRLIYDDFGCITTMPRGFWKNLQNKGIKCAAFNPFRPFLNIVLNNRDHRKICVVDGHTGFTGGINLADEYINRQKRFGHWKDTGVRLKGEGVWNLTAMFLQMWTVITRVPCNYRIYMPHFHHDMEFESDGFIQPYCDTPLDDEVVGENVYINIISRAKKYVYICTPYLIIDNEMMSALCLASKSGVDVRIMTPGIPDKKIVFLLTQSYYEQLLEAGVQILEYEPGFLHAKSFVCDDEIGVVGSINMDYRSLYLHFENGVWMYKSKAIMDIKKDYMETSHQCKQVTMDFCRNRNIVVRAIQSVMRVLAPML